MHRPHWSQLGRLVFRRAWKVWLTGLALAAIPLATIPLDCDPTKRNSYAGLGLQLLGLIVVALGIRDTRALFGQKTVRERLREWGHQLALALRGKVAGQSATLGVAGSSEGAGKITAKLTSAPHTLEERVKALEDNLASLQARLDTDIGDLRSGLERTRSVLEQEAAARSRGDEAIRELMTREAVGGLDLEIMGLVWIIVGTILGAMPEELRLLTSWAR